MRTAWPKTHLCAKELIYEQRQTAGITHAQRQQQITGLLTSNCEAATTSFRKPLPLACVSWREVYSSVTGGRGSVWNAVEAC